MLIEFFFTFFHIFILFLRYSQQGAKSSTIATAIASLLQIWKHVKHNFVITFELT